MEFAISKITFHRMRSATPFYFPVDLVMSGAAGHGYPTKHMQNSAHHICLLAYTFDLHSFLQFGSRSDFRSSAFLGSSPAPRITKHYALETGDRRAPAERAQSARMLIVMILRTGSGLIHQ